MKGKAIGKEKGKRESVLCGVQKKTERGKSRKGEGAYFKVGKVVDAS